MRNEGFAVVGIRLESDGKPVRKRKPEKRRPMLSVVLLGIILMGCLLCQLVAIRDPAYMDLTRGNVAPNREYLFGTDTLGRDIFSMIWFGGRISLFIGFVSTVISTVIAIVLGAVSGVAPPWVDAILMRFTEIVISIPNLLIVILLQAAMGKANVLSISVVIGVTSWMSIAKIVRTEVRQIRSSEYVVASRCMGAGFFRILWQHLAPNFVSSIMFMVVMNVRGAIVAESTLSFMGIGLPLEMISWGSMLSLSERAMMTASWWIILIPGAFLVVTLLCVTNIGNHLHRTVNRRHSNL